MILVYQVLYRHHVKEVFVGGYLLLCQWAEHDLISFFWELMEE
jgi:hypothetical protein